MSEAPNETIAAAGMLASAQHGILRLDGSERVYIVHDGEVDVFLVPVDGDNAREAKRYAHGLRIIPVKTFQQALQALATLPPKG